MNAVLDTRIWDAERSWRAAGRATVAAALLFAILPFASGTGDAEGSTLRQLIWSFIFAGAAVALFRRHEGIWESARTAGIPYWMLLAFAGGSVVWSADAATTIKRWILIAGVSLCAMALVAARENLRGRTYRIARPVCVFTVFLSVLVIAAFPSYGISELGWRGFTATKNNFGQLLALTIICWAAYPARGALAHIARVGLIGGSAVLLYLSKSTTSIVGVGAALGAGFSVWAVNYAVRRGWGIAMLLIVCFLIAGLLGLVVYAGTVSPGEILRESVALFGKKLDFTGRDFLWELMYKQIDRHPWLGNGFGAFWTEAVGESRYVALMVGWGYPGQAHNGYIDVVNELGYVGGVLLGLVIATHVINLVRLWRIDPRATIEHVMILAFVFTLNIAETAWLRTTALWWIVFVFSLFEVALLTRRGRST